MIKKIEYRKPALLVWLNEMRAGDGVWLMLRSDAHHDSLYCRRDLEEAHLKKALEKNALILDGGDLFDAMQGRFDPRRTYDDLRPEYKTDRYYNAIVEDAVSFYRPYANRWLLLARGNHETAAMRNAGIDLTSQLAYGMADGSAKDKIHVPAGIVTGGISGWVIFYASTHGGGGRSSVKLSYHHGFGGNAPVTRGVIQTNRQAVYIPDADIVWNGHNHNEYVLRIKRERISTHGRVDYDLVTFIRTPGYKDEYALSDRMTWMHEKGTPPTPHGCAWVRLEMAGRRLTVTEVISDVT